MTKQLILPVDLPDIADFSNFIVGENETVISALKHFIQASSDVIFYLWGTEGVGLTHLLMAACQRYSNSAYISLSQDHAYDSAVLDGLENIPLICIDDIECIEGDASWEQALFHCYNRVIAKEHKIIVASHHSPAQLSIQLPDLKSRLLAGSVYHVKPLNDTDKIKALKTRASLHGLEMSEEVAKYLLNHSERNTKSLFEKLAELEKENLTQQRKLTIPFVKEIID